MEQDRRSRTAEGAAAMRALHFRYADPIVFEDPFAIHLTSAKRRVICESRFLSWIMGKISRDRLIPIAAQVLARNRYAEDQLEKAIAAGVDQYVIVGAGMDSFALRRRDLAAKLKVFELDHPASQESKRTKLADLNIDLPENLEFTPVDFEKRSISDALKESSYSRERCAFFSWLGVTMYLSRDAIFRALESISSFAAPGSEIVFDYLIPRESIKAADAMVLENIERMVAKMGEPLITFFDPETFPREVCDLGFELAENLSPERQEARYFQNRTDSLRPMGSYFGHFRVLT